MLQGYPNCPAFKPKDGISEQQHSNKGMIYIYIYYLSFGDIVHHADGSQWGQVVTPGMVIHLKQSFTILNYQLFFRAMQSKTSKFQQHIHIYDTSI